MCRLTHVPRLAHATLTIISRLSGIEISRRFLLDGNHVQADRGVVGGEIAGVVEKPEGFYSCCTGKSGLFEIVDHEFMCQSDVVEVVVIHLPAKDHPHDVKTLVAGQFWIDKETA